MKQAWNKIFVGLLVLLTSFSTSAFAHDGNIPSPEGLTPPPPPTLPSPTTGQALYRIDSAQSSAQYAVQEVYVGGIEGKLVVGETTNIVGDVLVDWNNPAQSQLGMVTVNVEELTSDSKQRDRQIRKSYLESSLYPEATFIPEAEQVFPDAISVGETVSFVLHGFLTVHDVTVYADWMIELTLEADRLVGSATTDHFDVRLWRGADQHRWPALDRRRDAAITRLCGVGRWRSFGCGFGSSGRGS